MKTRDYTAAAHSFLSTFGESAHRAVGAYREAGERLATVADDRWSTAFAKSSPQLSKETRKNAVHAKTVFAGYYAKGLEATAGGAETAIDAIVEAAGTAVQRAAAFKQQFAAKA